jgi:heptosyltransferase-2
MRILYVKLGAIGDIVQSAIALTEYRKRFPATVVDWVTGSALAPLVESTGIADRVVGVDEAALIGGPMGARTWALARSMALLSRKCAARYDSIFTAYQDQRSRVLTLGIRCRTHRTLGDRASRPNYLVHRNRVHEYWRLLTAADSESIDIAAATACLGGKILQHARGTAAALVSGEYVVVAAGGARNLHRDDALRRWPVQNYRQLVAGLLGAGHRVVLVGAESDRSVTTAMQGLPVVDLIGNTSLMQLVDVMERATAVVANDSGIFHLATLTRTGLVGLFGPTPANAVAPMGRANTRILASDNRISCSPCYDGRNFAPCIRNICLESITVRAVADAIDQVSTRSERVAH